MFPKQFYNLYNKFNYFSLSNKKLSKLYQLSNEFFGSKKQNVIELQQLTRSRTKDRNYNRNQEQESFEYENYSKYFNLRFSLLALPILALFGFNQDKKYQCFFNSNALERNLLKNRVVSLQYAANNPIEDKIQATDLKNISGFMLGVFDGHGGNQFSSYVQKVIAQEFENQLAAHAGKYQTDDELITAALGETFEAIEGYFLEVTKKANSLGFSQVGNVGSCALIAVVHNNAVYVANLGDSRGYLIQVEKKTNKVDVKKINSKQNADSKKEQALLRNQFPNDPDIIVCKKGTQLCYVKNTLQPTRTFGDFRLKHKDYFCNFMESHAKVNQQFNGPYISHTPSIKKFDLNQNQKYLLLASDGLWDEVTKKEVQTMIEQNKFEEKGKLIELLFDKTIQNIAHNAQMDEVEIRNLEVGSRRKYHDDISIILLDLENQYKQ